MHRASKSVLARKSVRPRSQNAASHPSAAWVQALVYAMVLITVVSGADYYLNFRRRLEEVTRARESLARPSSR